MVVYSAFYLPVIFALLFQLNLDAWVSMRINYEVSRNSMAYKRLLRVNPAQGTVVDLARPMAVDGD
jgi:hypothetical protein